MKNKLYLLFFIPVLLLAWCGKTQENITENSVKWITVYSWQLVKWDSYVGYIEALNSTIIWPKMPGKIIDLKVDKWDYVKVWQILGSVDGKELAVSYDSASNILWSTNLMYDSTSAMFDAQIKAMEEKVSQAQKNIDLAKQALDGTNTWVEDTQKIVQEQLNTAKSQVEQSKIWIDSINSQIENTKSVLNQSKRDVYINSVNALSQANTLIVNVMDSTDQVLWITEKNKNLNDSFEAYLGAKNSSTKTKAENSWSDLNRRLLSLKNKISDITDNINTNNFPIDNEDLKNKIYNTLKDTESFMSSLRGLSSDMYKVFDNTIVSDSMTSTMISNYKTQYTTFQNNIDSALLTAQWNYLLWIKWSIQAIENYNSNSKLQLDALNKQLDIAKKQYDVAQNTYNQYLAISQWKINDTATQAKIKQTQYEIAQKQYDEALAWLESLKKQKQSSLSQINAQISQVKWNKNAVGTQLWDLNILAPFEWVIVEKLSNLWQVVWAGTPVFSLADDKQLKLKVYIPESLVTSVKIWSQVNVFIDSINRTFSWEIYNIAPMVDVASKKVAVEIRISNINREIKLWMQWNISFGWQPLDGILVPYSSVKYKYWEGYVNKVKGLKATEGSPASAVIEKLPVEVIYCKDDKCLVKGNIFSGDSIVN